ncbi:hypothetical protein J4204_04300 [Candidatus Woesearchaeota archaeon]|nr:hypothetical protein [Candidatus Woesearchaeota archaeon]
MKNKKADFLEWNINVLVSSIKRIGLEIILVIILDALFYFLSGYFILFWLQRIKEKGYSIPLQSPSDLAAIGYDKAYQLLFQFRYLIIFSAILLLVAIIFIASILKGIIWAKTTKTRISLALISKFLGLNLIWMGFWLLLVSAIFWLVEPAAVQVFVIAIAILALYLTNTLYTIFMKRQNLNSIIEAVKLNFAKIHLFLLPYAAMLSLLYAISRITNLVKYKYSPVFQALILLAYIAFARYYASTLAEEAQRL